MYVLALYVYNIVLQYRVQSFLFHTCAVLLEIYTWDSILLETDHNVQGGKDRQEKFILRRLQLMKTGRLIFYLKNWVGHEL